MALAVVAVSNWFQGWPGLGGTAVGADLGPPLTS
jgi:hypothetical protein